MSDWFRSKPYVPPSGSGGENRQLTPLPRTGPPTQTPTPKSKGWQSAGYSGTGLPQNKETKEALLGAQAAIVKQHFIRDEKQKLEKSADYLSSLTVMRLQEFPAFTYMTTEALAAAMQQMTFRLQQSDLTINFNAPGWFWEKNTTAK